MTTSIPKNTFDSYIQWYNLGVTKKRYLSGFKDIKRKNKEEQSLVRKAAICFSQLYLSSSPNLEYIQKNIDTVFAPIAEFSGLTAMHAAAIRGHIEALQIFLKSSPEKAFLVDRAGYNFLHHAAMCGHLEEVKESIRECFSNQEWKSLTEARVIEGFTPDSLQEMLKPSESLAPFCLEEEKSGERRVVYLTKEEFQKKSGGAEYTDKFASSAQNLIKIWKQIRSFASEEKKSLPAWEEVISFLTQNKQGKFKKIDEQNLGFYWDKNIEGLGVVALKNIREGSYFPYYGEIVLREKLTWKERIHAMKYGNKEIVRIVALEKRSLASCVNHGWPNVLPHSAEIQGYGIIPILIAIREIKAGEKIQTFYTGHLSNLGRYYLSEQDWNHIKSCPLKRELNPWLEYVFSTPAALLYKKLQGVFEKEYLPLALSFYEELSLYKMMKHLLEMPETKISPSLRATYIELLKEASISVNSLIQVIAIISSFPVDQAPKEELRKWGEFFDVIYELLNHVPYGSILYDSHSEEMLSLDRRNQRMASLGKIMDEIMQSKASVLFATAISTSVLPFICGERDQDWKQIIEQKIGLKLKNRRKKK